MKRFDTKRQYKFKSYLCDNRGDNTPLKVYSLQYFVDIVSKIYFYSRIDSVV